MDCPHQPAVQVLEYADCAEAKGMAVLRVVWRSEIVYVLSDTYYS